MKYKQLTAADRGAIEVLLQENFTLTAIANKIGTNKSTISREIKNRGSPNGYYAKYAIAQRKVKQKISSQNAKKIKCSRTRDYIIGKIEIGWSPEQISGRMKLIGREDRVCKETIYRYIYKDEYCKREKIYQYLRRGKKKRTGRKGRKTHKGKIPNRVSIEKRPRIVEKRREVGHWEGDSVIYPNKKAINTMNELKTGMVVFTKLERKRSELTARAMIKGLKGYIRKTMTLDNGTEFMRHEEVSKKMNIDIYFCDPYSSWERGANENCNMLLRGYLPKRYNIDELAQEELDDIAEELNNRPRKRLGYLTPSEVYQKELDKFSVAVRSGL